MIGMNMFSTESESKLKSAGFTKVAGTLQYYSFKKGTLEIAVEPLFERRFYICLYDWSKGWAILQKPRKKLMEVEAIDFAIQLSQNISKEKEQLKKVGDGKK